MPWLPPQNLLCYDQGDSQHTDTQPMEKNAHFRQLFFDLGVTMLIQEVPSRNFSSDWLKKCQIQKLRQEG